MAILRRAKACDFEKIYPLLLEFNNPRLTKDNWRELFVNHWDSQEDYFGYMLIDHAQVVGFLGLIFSDRLINNKIQKFCNITSGIVKKEYRSESLLLFSSLLKLKDYTVTDFTPSKEVYLILKKFGFKDVETRTRIIFPLPTIDFLSKCSIEFDRNIIKNYLDEKNLKIYCDHLKFKNIYLLIRLGSKNCYAIITKIRRKGFFFGRIHYISDIAVFSKCIHKVNMKICLHLKVCGLLINEGYLGGNQIKHSITLKRRYPTMIKSESLEKNNVDTLYSEVLVLNLL